MKSGRLALAVFAAATLSARALAAPDSGSVASAPKKSPAYEGMQNTLYFHPQSIVAMAASVFLPYDLVSVQVDYERMIIPHLAGIGTLSYQSVGMEVDGYDVEVRYFDVMAGVRWYPLNAFHGIYLQPVLNLDLAKATGSSPKKRGSLEQNRLGTMLYFGSNRRFGSLTLDWNAGIGYLPWEDSYNEVKFSTGERTTKKISDVTSYAGFLAGTPQFGMNMALGFGF
jgi:hypothetical protein